MFAVCLLTLNAGAHIEAWVAALSAQSRRPDRVLVMDSMSTDGTLAVVRRAGYEVVPVQRHEFGHGRTRQAALERVADCEIAVFMTQDALLASPDSLQRIVGAFDTPGVDVAYGRQLPHINASVIARHARLYNYPAVGEIRSLPAGDRPGLQVAFCSDSYAAYRVQSLREDGGFPMMAMYAEDMIVAARCLMRGKLVAYVAEATAYHSHNYSVWQEFQRYFDTGVFHNRNDWLLTRLGRAEGKGTAFVKSELGYLAKNSPWRLPEVVWRVFVRYAGYRMGRMEAHWPMALKRRWSMAHQF
jgi:rhamnosyltransferase